MRSFLSHLFNRFVAFVDIDLLLLEIFVISSVGIELIALWVVDLLRVFFHMRISVLLDEVRAIGGSSVERMAIRVVLIILDEDFLFLYAFRTVLIAVL